MKKFRPIALILSIIMLLAFTACAAPQAPEVTTGPEASASESGPAEEPEAANDKLAQIKAAGKITMGTSPDYAPFEFIDFTSDKSNDIVGIDIMVAEEIAKDLGVELVIQSMTFDSILAALASDSVDMALSAFTPDDERRESVDFTPLYYNARQAVLVRKGDESKYTSVDSFEGLKVGAQQGSTQENYAKTQLTGAVVHLLPEVPTLIMDLKAGNVEAVVLEKPVAENYIATNSDLVISGVDIVQDEEDAGVAVAVAKGNETLLAAITATVERLVAEDKVNKEFYVAAQELAEKQPKE